MATLFNSFCVSGISLISDFLKHFFERHKTKIKIHLLMPTIIVKDTKKTTGKYLKLVSGKDPSEGLLMSFWTFLSSLEALDGMGVKESAKLSQVRS